MPGSEIIRHDRLVVCVPCFNEEKHVEATLESIARQTETDFLVLITDNCSTDRTGEIARNFCARDRRFHYVQHDRNGGGAANFNSARALSESKYIMWVGGHDVIVEHCIQHHLAVLDSRPAVSVSQSAHAFFDDAGMQEPFSDGDLDFGSADSSDRYLKSIGANLTNNGANSMIRRSMLDDLWFAPIVGTDRVTLSHLAYRGPIADTPEVLYRRRALGDRTKSYPYMERLTGRAGLERDWSAMAAAYDQDLSRLLGDRPDATRLRRRAQLLLRYHHPVGLGTPLTTALWSIRRTRKWSGRLGRWLTGRHRL